jgi:hypothetical protein
MAAVLKSGKKLEGFGIAAPAAKPERQLRTAAS